MYLLLILRHTHEESQLRLWRLKSECLTFYLVRLISCEMMVCWVCTCQCQEWIVKLFVLCYCCFAFTTFGILVLVYHFYLDYCRMRCNANGVKMTRFTAVQYIKYQMSTGGMGGQQETSVFFCEWTAVRLLFCVLTEKLERERIWRAVNKVEMGMIDQLS